MKGPLHTNFVLVVISLVERYYQHSQVLRIVIKFLYLRATFSNELIGLSVYRYMYINVTKFIYINEIQSFYIFNRRIFQSNQ